MRDSGQVSYNQSKLVIAHLNINSLENKFELLNEKTKGNIDILLISKNKN